MFSLEAEYLATEPIPSKPGFPDGAMVTVLDPDKNETVKMWAPARVAEKLAAVPRSQPIVLGLSWRTVATAEGKVAFKHTVLEVTTPASSDQQP